MRENPELFFQKLKEEATGSGEEMSPSRTIGKSTEEQCPKRPPEALNLRLLVNVSTKDGGRGSAARRREKVPLCAVLVITLTNFAFGSEPVIGFVARLESAALRHQVSEAPDFFFHIDRNDSGTRLGLNNLRLGHNLLANSCSGTVEGGSVAVGFRSHDLAGGSF